MIRFRVVPLAALALLLGAGAPPRAEAQEIRIRGDDRSRAADLAREVLARGTYLRIDRDTILDSLFRAPADLVVYDAEVRLEGRVAGTVVILGGDLWLRPSARVAGPIAVIDGGVYPSALAEYGEIFQSNPSTVVDPDSVVIEGGDTVYVAGVDAPDPPARLSFAPPVTPLTYDRVNHVTGSLGLTYLVTRGERGSRASAWVSYRQNNPDHWGGGARLDFLTPYQDVRLVAEASRGTRTNDEWIRGALSNSISVATFGRDYRDYYDSDRLSLFLTRPLAKPLIATETWLGPRLGMIVEESRSLEAEEPWSIFETRDRDRENPPIDEGTLVSAVAGTSLHWRGRTSSFDGDAQVEQGLGGLGDFTFTQVLGTGRYRTFTFRAQSLEVYFRGMAALGADDAPRQRWGILGGPGTLATREIGGFRGDHLAFVESSYLVPLGMVQVPYLGVPSFELYHAAGAAWVGDEVPDWVQNVGAGLRFRLFRALVVVDPSDPDRTPELFIAASIPRS